MEWGESGAGGLCRPADASLEVGSKCSDRFLCFAAFPHPPGVCLTHETRGPLKGEQRLLMKTLVLVLGNSLFLQVVAVAPQAHLADVGAFGDGESSLNDGSKLEIDSRDDRSF